ncbi:MAG TPA: hypothetical protein PKM57_01170 [Kiritimatiellia bacterium]|mgnify:CR=1 FL=1|nr:hypothetical protein [Kiritimatiellia bacterium]
MPNQNRKTELVLVVGFLAVIASVPITQTGLELSRHQRVQFTDVFRYRPTASNLRQFEHTLEEKSWFQQTLRPKMQWLYFKVLRDTGAKGVSGNGRWLFYRPDLRYLVDPDRLETKASASKWVEPVESRSRRESVERAILRVRDQLKERGIALLVVPVPGKPSVYPDRVTRREAGKPQHVQSPTQKLIETLRREGVPTVDLFSVFSSARTHGRGAETNAQLYLACDTHWTPQGAQLAAQSVAAQLREMECAPTPSKEFKNQPVSIARWGDILEMMQIPGAREDYPAEKVACTQVLDPSTGLLVPTASDRPGTYRYPGQGTSVLVLGDSFCRIYQFPEPQSLGDAPATAASGRTGETSVKRLLPGSAGFISHLALALKSPVDAIVSDGGASTDVRRKLSTNPEILEGKKVVVWEFVERDIALGQQGWEDVPLPTKLD